MSFNDRGKGGSGGFERSQGGQDRPRDDANANIKAALADHAEIVFFTSGNKPELRFQLLGDEAEKQAKEMKDVKTSQIRRFYAPVVAFRQRLLLDPAISDTEVQAQVQHMKASAAYAGARKQPVSMVRFFSRAANSVKSRADYTAFARHFEAIIAYHRVFCEVKEGN